MYGHTYSKSMDQPDKIANPVRGQLNSRLRTWSSDTGSAAPSHVSLLISILRMNLVLTYYEITPQSRGGVHYLICTAIIRRYFQHAHFIPIIVGVGKRGVY